MACSCSSSHLPFVIARSLDTLGGQKLTSEGRQLAGVLVAFVMIVLLAALDLASDLGEGSAIEHVLIEGAVFIVGSSV